MPLAALKAVLDECFSVCAGLLQYMHTFLSLALVHLDHSIGANRGDRVVARFVRDEDGDRLLARANAASETPVKNEEISETGDTVDARGARARRIPRAH